MISLTGDWTVCHYSLAEKSPTVGVTPFLRHMREMTEYFKSFKNQTEKLEQFSKCETSAERIDLVYRAVTSSNKFKNVDSLFQDVKPKQKDPGRSVELRGLGNKLYAGKVYKEALATYTKAALAVSVDSAGKSEEISLALANRSAVYFHLTEYEKCLEDLEAALMFGYPEPLQYKIFDRKARCLMGLGRQFEAQESLEMASLLVQKSSLGEEEKFKFRQEMKRSLTEPRDVSLAQAAVLPSLTSAHPAISGLAARCEVQFSPGRGRHCTASSDCGPGQLVLTERPATWCLSHNLATSHCHHCCLSLQDTGFPSTTPGQDTRPVIFCSLDCLTTATASYHALESALPLSHIFSLGGQNGGYDEISGAVMMVIRAITQQPRHLLLAAREERLETVEAGSDKLRALLNMVTHHSSRSQVDLLSLTMKTVFILQLLAKMNYCSAEEDRQTVGPIVFQLLEVIQYNTHPLDKVVARIDPNKNLDLLEVGSAVFPTLAQCLNHSCDPSTVRVFHGNQIFLFARRLIRAGEEISDCYGLHYTSLARPERQRRLAKWFNFQCCCEACQLLYPVMQGLTSTLDKPTMDKLRAVLENFQQALKDEKVGSLIVHRSIIISWLFISRWGSVWTTVSDICWRPRQPRWTGLTRSGRPAVTVSPAHSGLSSGSFTDSMCLLKFSSSIILYIYTYYEIRYRLNRIVSISFSLSSLLYCLYPHWSNDQHMFIAC